MTTLVGPVSDFSLGESLLSPEDIARLAKSFGYTAVALVDDNLASMTRFAKACAKEDIQPIFGARLTIFDDALDKTPPKKRERVNRFFRVKVFAKNEGGMQEIYRLLSLANDADHFYYVPRLGYCELIEALSTKGLCVASGGAVSVFTHEDGPSLWKGICRAAGSDSAFYELSAVATPYFTRINLEAIQANDGTSPFLLSRPMLYERDEHADTLDILNAIVNNMEMSAPWRPTPYARNLALLGQRALFEQVKLTDALLEKRAQIPGGIWQAAIKGNQALAQMAQWRWHKREITLPGTARDEVGELNRWIAAGWKERLSHDVLGYRPTDLQPYRERLVHELTIIKKMGFVRYFLMVGDLVTWAKKNGVPVGPGRGSVGGSLIAYLIGITDVDPIRFHLMFERFINPDRLDLPDIDLDFATSQRERVLRYMVDRYGQENIAGVMNFSTLASASALRDVCRVHGLPVGEYDCTKLVPKENGRSFELDEAAEAVPEISKFKAKYPELWEHAVRLQGRMRAYGTHAAGVCVGGETLVKRAPVLSRQEGLPIISLDKREIEDAGLVKLDCLGLSTLDLLDLACRSIQRRTGNAVDLLGVSLDDAAVLQAFGEGRTSAIFQFESGGIRELLRSLAASGPLEFNDLVAATALYRPGPMQSGLLDQYVRAKNGTPVVYDHPRLQPVLEATLGVIVYQEQVSKTAQVLAGFSGGEADSLRKAMGKKSPAEMKKWREKFTDGCVRESGMALAHAEQLFDKIEKFAGYAFNLSHSVEYSVISWQSMWLKVHHPADFFAGALSVIDSDRWADLIDEAKSVGIDVLPPDINASGLHFDVGARGNIVAPLTAIKGISSKSAEAIIQAREKCGGAFSTIFDLLDNVDLRRCHKGIQEVLSRVGAFAGLDFSDPLVIDRVQRDFSWISVHQSPVTDIARQADQLALLPGLARVSSVQRAVATDSDVKRQVSEQVSECLADCAGCSLAGKPHVVPRFGRAARAMVVTDSPTWGEEDQGKLMEGLGSDYVRGALTLAGLSVADFYWTTLVKSRKAKGERISNEQINACSKYLEREIDILRPGLIVALGSMALKHLVKGSRFTQADACKVEFVPALNAAVLVGINPQSVYMDAGKQVVLNSIFEKTKSLLGDI